MVLRRQEHKPDPVKEVDTAERGDAQVEEDAEDDGRWDHPQERGQEDRDPDEQADAKPSHSLIWNKVGVLLCEVSSLPRLLLRFIFYFISLSEQNR